ncbi:MAG: hypothetical protein IK070_02510 [Clostridia bacterium]|nr:hypothetical protein [Clostridia bacterium]
MTKRRFIINMVVIVVLAVVSGYFIGSYIAGSKLVALTNSYNELALRDIEGDTTIPNYYSELPSSYLDKIQSVVSGKTPNQVSAIYAFMMAEYNTNTSGNVYKEITGNIAAKSMGINVNQSLISHKQRKDGKITIDKISYSSMAKVAFKAEHTIGEDTYTYYPAITSDETSATWGSAELRALSGYRDIYGNGIDYMCNYIVTPKTVQTTGASQVKQKKVSEHNDYYLDGETYYEFNVGLDIRIDEATGDFVYGGVSNYMYEIKSTANANDFPVFSYCNLHVVIDSHYRLVEINIEENYQIIAYGFNANTTVKQTEMFSYVK